MNIWVGVGFVTIYSALWTRRWFDDRDRKRLVAAHQAREARESPRRSLMSRPRVFVRRQTRCGE